MQLHLREDSTANAVKEIFRKTNNTQNTSLWVPLQPTTKDNVPHTFFSRNFFSPSARREFSREKIKFFPKKLIEKIENNLEKIFFTNR